MYFLIYTTANSTRQAYLFVEAQEHLFCFLSEDHYNYCPSNLYI